MAVRMNVAYDDGTICVVAGEVVDTFSEGMQARLVRSGLASPLTLNEARERAGMGPLPTEYSIEMDTLREQYRETVGRAPYYRWDADELRSKIAEAQED